MFSYHYRHFFSFYCRLIPLNREFVVNSWNHFAFRFQTINGHLLCYWNLAILLNIRIYKGQRFDWSSGILVVGAQQTGYDVVEHKHLQFHGQISQLQIWHTVLHYETIRALSVRCTSFPGSVFPWNDMPGHIRGSLGISRPSQCLVNNYGEP